MKIRLLQDYDHRNLTAGTIVNQELSEKVKSELVKDGKAEEIEKIKKAVRNDKDAS